ncbi:MAG: hypothetical protein A2266_09610 [Bacteroidetes bacterium RIFOXYA12_FULL_40_10]|nr:MAG: hypothetical protein A2X20_04070 [Bacteroidetes bacterium GWE2_40_15]OFY90904.1 MAG: hypothetical protein A2266_09610 [Bacteroidetes bacterium RIFOXYA12_FULL_40_10]
MFKPFLLWPENKFRHMRQQLFFILILALAGLLVLSGCQKDDTVIVKPEKQFVVDKIFDYNNNLVAVYSYDKENRLIKKSVTEHLGQQYQSEWAAYSDEFEYKSGLVSKIIHKDISYNQFNYETHIFYNSLGKITKTEVHIDNHPISSRSDYRYTNGLLTGTIKYNYGSMVYMDSIVYNNEGNVIKYIYETHDLNFVGQPIPDTKRVSVKEFEYDNHSRPNFNLDYLFIYEPLPFFEEADLQRQLSANNMTRFIDGSSWSYTYNEYGLPATIEVKWKDIVTTTPMLLRIVYKKVN